MAGEPPRPRPVEHSPHPTLGQLPGVHQEDRIVAGFCAAADQVLAPILAILDAFPAYLDPATVPEDVLAWLAGWIGETLPPGVPAAAREALCRATEHLPWHGTAHGIRTAAAVHGLDLDLEETGATAWSIRPGAPLPGRRHPHVDLTVHPADHVAGDVDRLAALLVGLLPVHVTHTIHTQAPAPDA
ncbi:MAG TPA: phage tail protein [Sporichthyaceae bacterium]|nr:phage tail protein [Sporichthyaceae bacterium]